MKVIHPEGIVWPGSVLYNAVSSSGIFLKHYKLAASDVANYGTAGSILDIGTGPGRFLLALRQEFPDSELVGVDISPAMVEQAHRNLKKRGRNDRIDVRIAGANSLPFADGTFDRVVSTGSLHHWKDPVQALAEVHRVLQSNGYALMYDLVRHMPNEVKKYVRAKFGRFRFVLLWLHSFEEPFLNVEEMEDLGRLTDFNVMGTKFIGALCCLILRKDADPAAKTD